jgi:hypothetical protein
MHLHLALQLVPLFQPSMSNQDLENVPTTSIAFAAPTDLSSSSMPNQDLNIDFTVNYYRMLGVEPHSSMDAIERGFQSKVKIFSPASTTGKLR